MRRCAIIAAAKTGVIGDLRGCYVICADGGVERLKLHGVTPDLYVGDGDSADIPEGVECAVFPPEKDYSDLQLAIDIALEKGFDDITLYHATGGRFDHHFANVCLLERIHKNGARGQIIDENNIITYITEGTTYIKRNEMYPYISLLPLDEALEGVTYKGLLYGLTNAVIKRTSPIAVSNAFLEDTAVINIDKGAGLLIFSRD